MANVGFARVCVCVCVGARTGVFFCLCVKLSQRAAVRSVFQQGQQVEWSRAGKKVHLSPLKCGTGESRLELFLFQALALLFQALASAFVSGG